jgi:hypothetical protein
MADQPEKRKQRGKGGGSAPHEVVFYSYPKLLFSWPLLVLGPVLWFFAAPGASEALLEAIGWVYLLSLVLVVLTIGVDFERNIAFFWAIVILLFYFLGLWLSEKSGFTLFGNLFRFFAGLDVSYSRGLGLAISVLLAIPYTVMLVWARLQHKWRITHNEFERYAWGRADDSLARGAKRVRSSYPDLLELLLCGSGTLVVYSATGRTELVRIRNVPLLPLKRKRIDKILEQTAVTATPDSVLVDEEAAAEQEESVGEDQALESSIGKEEL